MLRNRYSRPRCRSRIARGVSSLVFGPTRPARASRRCVDGGAERVPGPLAAYRFARRTRRPAARRSCWCATTSRLRSGRRDRRRHSLQTASDRGFRRHRAGDTQLCQRMRSGVGGPFGDRHERPRPGDGVGQRDGEDPGQRVPHTTGLARIGHIPDRMTSSSPAEATGISANLPSSGSESSTTDTMSEDDAAGTAVLCDGCENCDHPRGCRVPRTIPDVGVSHTRNRWSNRLFTIDGVVAV